MHAGNSEQGCLSQGIDANRLKSWLQDGEELALSLIHI